LKNGRSDSLLHGTSGNLTVRISPKKKTVGFLLRVQYSVTLKGSNISHLGKGKIILKVPSGGDTLVPRRVQLSEIPACFWGLLKPLQEIRGDLSENPSI